MAIYKKINGTWQDATGNNEALSNSRKAVKIAESKTEIVLVDVLPEEGVLNKIYSVPTPDGYGENYRAEFYWTGSVWEILGAGDDTPYGTLYLDVIATDGNPDLSGIAAVARPVNIHSKSITDESDEQGIISLRLSSGVVYDVTLSKPDFVFEQPGKVMVEAGTERMDVYCHQMASALVCLTGADVAGRRIMMTGDESRTLVTDNSGHAEFTSLEPGEYRFSSDYPDGQGVRPEYTDVMVESGKAYTVDAEILSKPKVEIEVTDGSEPVGGVTVYLIPDEGNTQMGVTNGRGIVEIEVMPDVIYSLRASVPEGYETPAVQKIGNFLVGMVSKVPVIVKKKV